MAQKYIAIDPIATGFAIKKTMLDKGLKVSDLPHTSYRKIITMTLYTDIPVGSLLRFMQMKVSQVLLSNIETLSYE